MLSTKGGKIYKHTMECLLSGVDGFKVQGFSTRGFHPPNSNAEIRARPSLPA